MKLGRLLALAAAILGLLIAASPAAAATPIPSTPADGPSLVPDFTGSAATPQSVSAPAVPQNLHMAPNGFSNVHDDAYQTDTYTWSGPLGRQPTVNSQFTGGGICGITIGFDSQGRLLTNCISQPDIQRLTLLDPTTLDTLATYDLPNREIPAGVNPFVSGGGAYFYIDDQDRAVISVVRHLMIVADRGGASDPHFELVSDFDLSSVVHAPDQLNSAIPDWKGRIWFVTRDGIVGVIDPDTGQILDHVALGEGIENSFATDNEGGVYIVSDAAQYRFDATRKGRIKQTWRKAYDNSHVTKPGQFTPGSGTTPTLMGKKYVAITDNADPMQIVVYQRGKKIEGKRVVCEHAVFEPGASATENSLIGTGRSMIVENNYGYAPPPDATSNGGATTPGIERVDVVKKRNGKLKCKTKWESNEIAPSVVPKLSLANGLVYTITKGPGEPDAWYLTAIEFATGRTAWSKLLGTGAFFNNHYAGISISPRGDLYSGVLGGTVRVVDGG